MTPSFDGLYVLASLDGAPLSPRDLAVLGLPSTDGSFAVAARDRGTAQRVAGDPVMLGHLDDHRALAATLGLDPATTPADLVLAAVGRYGDDTPAHVPGEWAFLHWDPLARTLTLMVADTVRDPLLFATDGRRVAVAPHVRAFRSLDGIDAAPDGHGLLLHMGREAMRGTIGDRTILRDVRRVVTGTRVRIARGGVTAGQRAPLPAPTRWQGSFADAVDALDAVLRDIVRQQMARHPTAAVMLSGGLDSSLIATYAAAERGSSSLFAVTSAAPAGSGLPDEAAFARAVVDQAGIAMVTRAPPADADVYLPSAATLRWLQHPLVSPRHYVYDMLYDAAIERGADAILDGCQGEATITGRVAAGGWRHRLRGMLDRAAGRTDPLDDRSLQGAFHVRLSAHAVAVADQYWGPEPLAPPSPIPPRAHGDVCGYSPAIAKTLMAPTTTPLPPLRRLLPFRDRRLLTLFAGMPCAFLTHAGVTRAPGRALLAGKVPEHVRMRPRGLPFSPDYHDRIRRQAAPARDRLPDFVAAGVDEWLDLAWLDTALARIAAGASVSLATVFEVQTTAMAAAFLADWASGDREAWTAPGALGTGA